MFRDPVTIADAHEMGVPECFSEEYAYHERNGTLPPYSGPAYPDYYQEEVDYFDPRDTDTGPPRPPCEGPPTHAFLGMPAPWHPHEPWCWDHHAPDADGCPPPF